MLGGRGLFDEMIYEVCLQSAVKIEKIVFFVKACYRSLNAFYSKFQFLPFLIISKNLKRACMRVSHVLFNFF